MRTSAIVLFAAGAFCALLAADSRQLPPPAGALRTIVETSSAPAWIALPRHGQLQVPYGMTLEMVHAAVLSRSQPREAVLFGVLRNRGGDAADVTVTLHYLDADGGTLHPTGENAAAVSWVPAGGLLPFRLPLAAAEQVSGRAVLYRLVVDAEVRGAPRPLTGARVEVTKRRSLARGHGVAVAGFVEIGADRPPAAAAGVIVTLLLLDGDGRVLDVVADRPFRSVDALPASGRWPFEIRTTMPASKPVREVRAWLTEDASLRG